MKLLNDITTKKQKDFIAFGIVTVLYFLFVILQWAKSGTVTYDCGREAYLPELLLKGKILYKEIFAMYNPLAYQFNALLYKLFGSNLNVLYYAAVVNTYLILTAVYSLCRQFLKPLYSLIPCIIFLGFCVFNSHTCVNYLFPYSYAFIYSVTAFMYFVLFSVFIFQSNDKFKISKYSIWISIFMGISLAFRFEFVLAYLPFIIFLIFKKTNLKIIFLNLFIFCLPFLLSWGVLFCGDFGIHDLIDYIKFAIAFFESPEQKFFELSGLSLNSFILHFPKVAFFTVIFSLLAYLNVLTFKMLQSSAKLKRLIGIIMVLSVCVLTNTIAARYLSYLLFSALCLSSVYIIINSYIKRDANWQIWLILAFYALLSSVRVGFIYIADYSIYILVLPIIINFIYFIEKINDNKIKNYIAIFLLIISLESIIFNTVEKFITLSKIKTVKGIIYDKKDIANVYNQTIERINNTTTDKDTILMLPEGPMINFLTDRKTNNKYYHLLPNHISALKENKIVDDLTKNPPEYIMVESLSYSSYGKEYFGINFGKEIFNFIIQNYSLQEKITSNNESTEFFIVIFKRNNMTSKVNYKN